MRITAIATTDRTLAGYRRDMTWFETDDGGICVVGRHSDRLRVVWWRFEAPPLSVDELCRLVTTQPPATVEPAGDGRWRHIWIMAEPETGGLWCTVPRSQKARGALWASRDRLVSPFLQPGPEPLVARAADLVAAGVERLANDGRFVRLLGTCVPYDTALFVRPCPLRPRHGFVESRPIVVVGRDGRDVAADVIAVAEEVVAVEPEGEIMLAPTLVGPGAVWTPGWVAIGATPAGATDRGAAMLRGVDLPLHLPPETLAGLGVHDTPYIETVGPHVVQVRDGPAPDRAQETRTVTVRRVLRPEDAGDGTEALLAWERLVAEADPSDTVVHLPPDVALTSHWGAHAIARGLAVVREPVEPGETVTVSAGEDDPRWPEWFLQGWALAEHEMLPRSGSLLRTDSATAGRIMLAGVHLAAVLPGAALDETWADTVRLAGFALAGLAAVNALACCGEARHVGEHSHAPIHTPRRPSYRAGLRRFRQPFTVRREAVYGNVGRYGFAGRTKALLLAARLFHHCDWVSNYGGRRWYEIALATLRLSASLRRLAKAARRWANGRNERDLAACRTALAEAVRHAHRALHLVHNGGAQAWRKLVSVPAELLDDAARHPLAPLYVGRRDLYGPRRLPRAVATTVHLLRTARMTMPPQLRAYRTIRNIARKSR